MIALIALGWQRRKRGFDDQPLAKSPDNEDRQTGGYKNWRTWRPWPGGVENAVSAGAKMTRTERAGAKTADEASAATSSGTEPRRYRAASTETGRYPPTRASVPHHPDGRHGDRPLRRPARCRTLPKPTSPIMTREVFYAAR